MRSVVYILFIFLVVGCEYNDVEPSSNKIDSIDYSGVWESKSNTFENTLELERIHGDKYRFSFNGWTKSYDHFLRDTTKFLGFMNDDDFIIVIQDGYAEFIDSKDKLEDGYKLYAEDEETCKLFFQFRKNKLKVKTEDCHLIYGGYGVLFDGEYFKR